MKLLSEEKTGLKPELRILSFFLLLISSDLSFAQIPVNGFCKLNTFSVDPGVNSILSLNYNKDAFTDLFLFNPRMKRASVLEGLNAGDFRYERKINLPLTISNIEPAYNQFGEIEGYAFTSRSERTFGLLSFSTAGQPLINHRLRFDTYPENVSIADINGNRKNEYMVSGGSFEGISIISLKDGKLVEEKIITGTSFGYAHFVDLNNNGSKDIAAYNLFSGMIHFLFNNGEGVFREARRIPFYSTITQFRIFDVNSDSNFDLVISSENSIRIFYGDFRAAFDSSFTINTAYPVDDFVIGDFNLDGNSDISYISKNSGVIATIFGKSDGTFHQELFHLQRDGIQSIQLYSGRSVNGFVYLTNKGELGMISRLSSIENDFDLAVTLNPAALNYSDNTKNKIAYLVFIDGQRNSLNLITRNNQGIPLQFYSTSLFGNHQHIIAEDSDVNIKSFYCYSAGAKLIEIKSFDLLNNSVKREQIYVPGNLVDLKVVKIKDKRVSVYAVYKKDNKTFIGEFIRQDSGYNLTEHFLADDVLDTKLIGSNTNAVYIWKKENNQLTLSKVEFISGKATVTKRQSVSESRAEIVSVLYQKVFGSNYILVSFIQGGEGNYISIVTPQSEELNSFARQVSGFRIKNKNHLSFDSNNIVFFFDDFRKSIRKIELSEDFKRIRIQDVFKNISLNDFIVKNLDSRNKHLIYTDSEKKSISIKRLQ